MLPIMLYLLLITCLLGAAALAAERLVARLGLGRRGAWMLALLAAVALPLSVPRGMRRQAARQTSRSSRISEDGRWLELYRCSRPA